MDTNATSQPDPRPASGAKPGRRIWFAILLVVVGAVLGGGAMTLLSRGGHAPGPEVAAPAPKPLYQCPMHPTITADHPSDCPICGMKLVEVKQAAATSAAAGGGGGGNAVQGLATVTIDPARQQLIGLRTAPAVSGTVAGSWRTVGRVEVDPTAVRKVNVKVEGYIDHLFVDFVGSPVRKGEPLFSFYSPSLLAAESEYLLARRTHDELAAHGSDTGSGQVLLDAARRKLELWDVPAAEVARLERDGQPLKSVTIVSPIAGVVTAKNVVEGARLNPGDTPFEVTDLGMVWVMADAYEGDLARVSVGLPATFTVRAYADRSFAGEVAFIDPLVDARSRTTKVHIHLANPDRLLKPEMFGDVVLKGPGRDGLLIPADAVIRSGEADVVFVALGDGKFEPRVIALGTRSGEQVEVTSGLAAGEEVVVRANFLVDSESQLRASLAAIGGR